MDLRVHKRGEGRWSPQERPDIDVRSSITLHSMITNLNVGLHTLKVKADGFLIEVPNHLR